MVEALDDMGRHSRNHTVAWHVFNYNGIGSDEHIVTDGDAAYHFSTAAHLHVVAYHGSLQVMVKPYCDLLIDLAVIANLLGRDDSGKTMLNYQAPANVISGYLKGVLSP